MQIHAFPTGPFSTNGYVVSCPSTGEAAIIDPAPGSCAPILLYLKSHSLDCKAILLTHSHWDHIADVASCKKELPGAKIYVHPLDAPNLTHPGADHLPCWISIPPSVPDLLIKEGDSIWIGTLQFTVMHTPGHSPGGVCFYAKNSGVVFSGDTLFKGAIGNLSLPTGQPERMRGSLDKLEALPPETIVYPGHGRPTEIGSEFNKR